ncbi:MAG: AraC family transcriptional regulator, partial [Flavobacteriaceae bacterium]
MVAHTRSTKESLEVVKFQDSVKWADYYYNIHRYKKAIDIYQKSLSEQPEKDKKKILKKLALSEAALNNPEESVAYLEKYLLEEFNTAFIQHEGFDTIRSSNKFETITKNYLPKLGFWAIFYLFISLVGFYISAMLLINNSIDSHAKILIAAFVFIHSTFILHISISIANYQYEYPHTYLMSTLFSYLYGPLLYFYLKRITKRYIFKARDLLHLIPTVLLALYVIPNHLLLTADRKLQILLERAILVTESESAIELMILTISKTILLLAYGLFIRKLYLNNKRNDTLTLKSKKWFRKVYHIHFLYILAYMVYGILVALNNFSGIFFHVPTICMAAMVIFIGYSASVQPNLVNGVFSYSNKFMNKYKKSGLTNSLSHELKENLLYLFAVDKIYKENNINLDMVSQKLNTTRHNTSQIINEHFQVSFHEFVNIYRIKEAKQLLLDDESRKLNIINV